MPQDLYRWESGGGLIHHCPHCHTPLTHTRARTKCLGTHVEWCKAYHHQLFKRGSSSQCMACLGSHEVHRERHRRIAEVSRQLQVLQSSEGPPMSSSIINGCRFEVPQDSPTAKTKRERKMLKSAERTAKQANAIMDTDIDHVMRILYPHACEEDEDFERILLQDQDILSNLPFHAGTSLGRELRQELIAYDKSKNEFIVPDSVVYDRIEALGVRRGHCPKNSEERKLLKLLKNVVSKELLSTGREHQETMIRKAGFWRWASKKAYNKLVRHGMIWELQDGVYRLQEKEEAEDDSVIDTEDMDGEDTDFTHGSGSTLGLDEPSDSSFSTRTLSTSSATSGSTHLGDNTSMSDEIDTMNESLTPIGRRTVKLIANDGLHHFMVIPPPLNHYDMLVEYESAQIEDEEYF